MNKASAFRIKQADGTYSDPIAFGLDDRYTIDGVHLKKQHTTHYGVCETTAAKAVKVVNIPHFELVTGATVYVKFTVKNTASTGSLQLNVSNTGAYPIKYKNGNIPTADTLNVNYLVGFIFDGTYWQAMGFIDTNTVNTLRGNTIYTKEAIAKYNILVNNGDGYFQLNSGNVFDISYQIVYSTDTVAANKSLSPWIYYGFGISTTQNMTLVSRQPIFVKGTLNGNKFTPISTTPLTQTIPTTEDGYQYLYLGWAYSTSSIQLVGSHPIYEYVAGLFRPYHTAFATNADIDAMF